jgi:hypothetical protein
MTTITVNISDTKARRLATVARERALSHDEVVQEALSLFIEGDPRKVKLARNLETIERNRQLLAEGS